MKIGIIDYGAGNIKSVNYAMNRLECSTVVTNNVKELNKCDKIIFPGVGHAKPAMDLLLKNDLNYFIKETKKPLLGICLGMQLLCEFTEEGSTNCLAIYDSKVLIFEKRLNVKVPHVGWNTISANTHSLLFKEIRTSEYFYFVHIYYVPIHPNTEANCEYGLKFSAAMAKDNYFGVQFHPEKSGKPGMKLLENFILL